MNPEDAAELQHLLSSLGCVFLHVRGYDALHWAEYEAAVREVNAFMGHERPEEDRNNDATSIQADFWP